MSDQADGAPERTERKKRRARFFRGAAAGAAGLLALYGGWWSYTVATLQDTLALWSVRQRSQGWDVELPEPVIGGFPFGIVATFGPTTLAETAGGWSWRSPGGEATVHPLNAGRVTLRIPGRHTIRLPPAWGGALVTLDAEGLMVEITHTWGGRPQHYIVTLDGARIEGFAAPVAVHAAHGTVQWRDDEPSVIVATFDGKGIDLPPALDLPVGPRVEAVTLKSEVRGAIPPGDLAQALAKWREAGGTLEVNSLLIHWPPLKVQASGTLALDEQLQPVGALSARVQGLFEALDSLSRRGVIRARDTSMAKVVLGMLAQPPQEGGPPVISLPLTIQAREMLAGPVRLFRLPDIRWSARHDPGLQPLGPVRLLRPQTSPEDAGE
ncbi:MAG: hypothetical protein FD149_1629 [Rhodospirillaceae bacterium]|nr:MAG: hypothetical protein FD149_1629 [Rhodospirillaceae bacterium]